MAKDTKDWDESKRYKKDTVVKYNGLDYVFLDSDDLLELSPDDSPLWKKNTPEKTNSKWDLVKFQKKLQKLLKRTKEWKKEKNYKKDDLVKYNGLDYIFLGLDSLSPDKSPLWKLKTQPQPTPEPQPEPEPKPEPQPEPTPAPEPTPEPPSTPVVSLDISELKDLNAKNTTWNIFKVGHGSDNDLHKIVQDPLTKQGNVLQVYYPKDSFKPSGKIQGGIGFYASPKAVFPCKKITLSYELYFADNFDPIKGGKLPGLFIGDPGASGGNHDAKKASCRIMWRTNLDAEAYVYMPCKQDKEYESIPNSVYNPEFGDSLWRGLFKFQRGKWNKVSISLSVNEQNRSNGSLTLVINETTKSFNKLTWSISESVISGITTDTFFGGGDKSWATPDDTFIYFKNFRLQ